ncbi:DMT family transporter [Halorussus caseinilyticus]|uniref:DMT family transporter n=1 Tax=Halorussus caseinilyticus TaxID=3034025 RepID=A0ABD5WI96_9EURY|nr:DMT family transporter [Halorussus sp. DT72]
MSRARDIAAFLLMALLFGGAFPAIEVGLRSLPPLLLAGVRYGVSGALLLGYALVRTDDWRPRVRADFAAVLAGGVFFIGGSGLTFVGQQYTTAGTAAVVFSAIPILTVVVGHVLLPGERVSRRGAVGLVVGVVGVAIVVRPESGGSKLGAGLVGEVLVFLAALSVTLGTVLVRRSDPPMPVVALTGWSMVLGAVIQVALGVAVGESFASARFDPAAVLALAYLAVLASGVGFVVYFDLLSRVGPLEVNLVSYLVPVVSVVVGWVLLGEPVSPSTLAGFGVIVAGFALLKDRELAAELAKYRGAAR